MESKFKSSDTHDKNKKMLKDDVDSDGEPIPDMLKLEGHTDNSFEEDDDYPHGAAAAEAGSNIHGSRKVVFFGRNGGTKNSD